MNYWLVVIALILAAVTIGFVTLAIEARVALREQAPCSLVCPCGGEWGKWQKIEVVSYTTGEATQTRYCTECGRADRRIVK